MAQRSARVAVAVATTGTAVTGAVDRPHLAAATSTRVWDRAFGANPVSTQTFLTRAVLDNAESAGATHPSVFMASVSVGGLLGGVFVDRSGPTEIFALAGAATLLGATLIASSKTPRAVA